MVLRTFATTAVLLAAGMAHAATYTLADLAAGGGSATFTSDDGTLTFSNFDVTRTRKLSSDLSLYVVTTTANGFELTSTEFDVATGGHRKLDFSFQVTASAPIVQAGLDLDATRSSGRVLVNADLEDPASDEGTFLATLLTGNASVLTDSDQFSPGVSTFDVEQQVRIKKVSRVGGITSSFQVVPEPGVAALLGVGVAGLAWFGRYRRTR